MTGYQKKKKDFNGVFQCYSSTGIITFILYIAPNIMRPLFGSHHSPRKMLRTKDRVRRAGRSISQNNQLRCESNTYCHKLYMNVAI